MEAKYTCCRSKTLSGFYCTVCFGVFHASCLDRRNGVVRLGGHKIYCSGSCQERDTDREMETESFRESIQGLKEEIEGRERYIQRLQRQSRDFEDEVLNTEQKYVDKLKQLSDTVQCRNREVEELRVKISTLEREIDRTSDLRVKLESDIRDLDKINRDMISTIKTLEIENDSYVREVKLLRVELDSNKSRGYGDKVEKHSVTRGTGSKTAYIQDNRPKLLLVAGAFGRDLVQFLRTHSGNSYHMQAILKPNSSNQELIDTAVRNSKSFSKKDVVVICPFSAVNQLIDGFLLELGHTNALILTTPFGRDTRENFLIYENNLSLYKRLHFCGLNLSGILDCNSVLSSDRISCFSKQGKQLIARAIWRRLLDLTVTPVNVCDAFLDPCLAPAMRT